MADVYCANCGNRLSDQAVMCPQCGHPTGVQAPQTAVPVYVPGGKSRITAGILALLVGGLGVHKFYLEKVGLGILYLLFSWTFVPSIISFIEGIVYLTQTDEAFGQAQGVRVTPGTGF